MLREVDREPAVVLLQQAHPLAPQNFTQKHLVLLPTKMTLAPHTAHQHIRWVLRCGHLLRIFSRGGLINLRWRAHAQRFVRTHLIVFPAKAVQSALLLAPVGGRRVGDLLFQRAMHAFVCLPFCSGFPASIRSGTMPSLIHQTANRDSPASARLANGPPLSVRMAAGRPYWRKAASKMACTLAVSVFSTAWQRNRYRLCASEMVSGSMRSPSAVRNQPLKSAHHTRFGPSACASGALYGAVRTRFLRGTTKPSRCSSAPMVLAAGQLRPGSSRSRMRLSLRGPHRICACRSSNTHCSISSGFWLRCRCAAQLCAISPAAPASW